MNKGLVALLAGLGVGGAAMYMLDPDRGRRRRSVVRDKAVSTVRTTGEAVGKTSRDVVNRTTGLVSETKSVFTHGEARNGDVLTERVRSKLGRLVSHPGSIQVHAEHGRVTLRGPVFASEVGRLIAGVYSVKGVKEVENQLEVHETPDNVPGLMGEPETERLGFGPLQRNWPPAVRLLTGLAGAVLAFYGLRRKGMLGSALSTAGFGLISRGATNLETKRMVGLGAGRKAIDIEKTININAPIERVFDIWVNYENFPLFMSNVREVRKTSSNMSHWKVAGPGGATVEWDAVVTEFVPNRVLAWKTSGDSPVAHSGRIHFSPNPSGSTRVQVQLSYNPIAGGLGHVVASLFGADPKKEMDEDLDRMKSYVETGRIPSGAAFQSR